MKTLTKHHGLRCGAHRAGMDRRAAGLSLMELLLAVAITSVVGLAAAGMLSAASYGSSERADLRAMMIRQELIAQRLAAAGRSSREVLEYDDDTLVLWQSDANNDGQPQVSEVRWIVWDSAAKTITSTHVDFPSSLTPEQLKTLDRAYNPQGSMATQLAGLGNYSVTEVWSSDVADLSWTASSPTDERRPLLSYRLTISDTRGRSQTMIGAAALRSQ